MRIGKASASTLAPVLMDTRANGSRERILASNGELNAGSKKELVSRIIEMAGRLNSGEFAEGTEEVATAAERHQMLVASYEDKTGTKWAELGASISADITEHVSRAGFMRRFLARGEVAQGSIPRVRTRQKNVDAVLATGPAQVAAQVVRDKYLYPSEFDIVAHVRVEQRELNQGSSDLLQEKYADGLEAIMVAEDRTFKRLADVAAPTANDITLFSGAFQPSTVSALQYQVMSWNLPAASLLIAMNLLPDMNSGTAWNAVLDPVSRLEILMTGRLGTVYGMDLVTDGLRDPRLQVLRAGEVYVLSLPEYVGAYTDRGPVQAEPRTNDGSTPGRGWFMSEQISAAVATAKGIARGIRT